MAKPVTYIAIDIEANGPIPGPFSMLALGSVAYNSSGEEIGDFNANLLPLDNAAEDPSTMKFWAEHPEVYQQLRRDAQPAQATMMKYLAWLGEYRGQVIALTKPKGFDFMWIYWYLRRFVDRCPFGWECVDMRSYISGRQKILYKNAVKSNLPEEWFIHMRHTHVPVEDARDIGEMWWKIVGRRRKAAEPEPMRPTGAHPVDPMALNGDAVRRFQEQIRGMQQNVGFGYYRQAVQAQAQPNWADLWNPVVVNVGHNAG